MGIHIPYPTYPVALKVTTNGLLGGDNPLSSPLNLYTLQLVLVVVISRILHWLMRPLRQPRVVAEITTGILLGPSFLGTQWPSFYRFVFPKQSLIWLNAFSTLGITFFVFSMGLQVDSSNLKKSGPRAIIISFSGVIVPALAGILLSWIFYETVYDPTVKASFVTFTIFIASAMSLTAFPLLTRVVRELGLNSEVSDQAISAGTVDDALAYVVIILVTATANIAGSKIYALYNFLLFAGFTVIFIAIFRPIYKRLALYYYYRTEISEPVFIGTVLGALVAGFITDMFAITQIPGVVLLGYLIPREGNFAPLLGSKIVSFVEAIFVPAIFAYTGLVTNVGAIQSSDAWWLILLTIFLACFGKIAGAGGAAYFTGMVWRKALMVGVMLNAKGLIEIAILTIGLQKNIVNQDIFTIMVIMAVVTTGIATPLAWILNDRGWDQDDHKDQTLVPTNVSDTESDVSGEDAKLSDLKPAATGDLRVVTVIRAPESVRTTIGLIGLLGGTKNHSEVKVLPIHVIPPNEVPEIGFKGKVYWVTDKVFINRDPVDVSFRLSSRLQGLSLPDVTQVATEQPDVEILEGATRHLAHLTIVPYQEERWLESLRQKLGFGRPGFSHTSILRVQEGVQGATAVLYDRHFDDGSNYPARVAKPQAKVLVLFYGGPDDRALLALSAQLLKHHNVALTVVRFTKKSDHFPINLGDGNADAEATKEQQKDSAAWESLVAKLEGFVRLFGKAGTFVHRTHEISGDVTSAAIEETLSNGFALILVGLNTSIAVRPSILPPPATDDSEDAAVGLIGKALISSGRVQANVLVVHQGKGASPEGTNTVPSLEELLLSS